MWVCRRDGAALLRRDWQGGMSRRTVGGGGTCEGLRVEHVVWGEGGGGPWLAAAGGGALRPPRPLSPSPGLPPAGVARVGPGTGKWRDHVMPPPTYIHTPYPQGSLAPPSCPHMHPSPQSAFTCSWSHVGTHAYVSKVGLRTGVVPDSWGQHTFN